jgi:chaperonin GroES
MLHDGRRSLIPSASQLFLKNMLRASVSWPWRPWLPGACPFQGVTMKFRPLHDRVAIRRIKEDTKSKGGILIPETAREKPVEGEVVAVGPGRRDEAGKLIPVDVKTGETILFGKWSGTEVKIDGEDLLIIQESDIMGVVVIPAVTKAA